MPALITWWTTDVLALAPDADPTAVQDTGAELLRRWTEPHRRYHGTRHLVEIFWALDELTEEGGLDRRDATVGRIAGWLHDAVYDPHAAPGDTERASAALARELLPHAGLADTDVSTVERLVLATIAHEPPTPATDLDRAFLDADLWILSAPDERFDEYCAQVRDEYAHVPDAAYRVGRSAILHRLAERTPRYLTTYAAREWEPRVDANLVRELARLS
ncbi:MAG TPA: hypothetical protein P5181_15600 [Dermatophilaceae bacterium]|nr:hypothetical protein [Dermatophilaceae bacterium]